MTAYDMTDKNSLDTCLVITSEFFKAKTGNAAHQVYAIGNCHIDTAWLWPYNETKHKITHSWSTQLGLIEKYPDYMFAALQVQQFKWLKEFYLGLFAHVKEQIKEGQFIPIGRTWVEMGCNIPSRESFVCQFLLGQKFFEENFGKCCKVFWLPDTFGYSSQLLQIMKLSGAEYFFTQKLSLNNINKFPHMMFHWVGLDSSDILCHMCPADTYKVEAKANQLILSVKKHKDIGYTNESLYLYGFGNGSGIPSKEMLEHLSWMKNIDALSKVKHAHPNEFYNYMSKNSKDLVM
ncbi:Glycoside hydrolase, 38 vacuolar alpha mannosidase [Coemansia asiatica]|nr:Glycoside hydrolase, 38 vacuolar alpha mannosidase [Coemansia asiatica]